MRMLSSKLNWSQENLIHTKLEDAHRCLRVLTENRMKTAVWFQRVWVYSACNITCEQQEGGENSAAFLSIKSLLGRFPGNVCVTAALIKGISKDYIPHELGRHYQH